MSKMITSAAVLMALFAFANEPAFAGEQLETKSVSVYYGDLDLANPRDRATLHRRLSEAAKKVCSQPSDDIKDRDQRKDRKRCMAQALDRAYASIGNNRSHAQVTN